MIMNVRQQETTTLTDEARRRLGQAIAFILSLAEEGVQDEERSEKAVRQPVNSDQSTRSESTDASASE